MNRNLIPLALLFAIGSFHDVIAAPLKVALIDPFSGPLASNGKIYEVATKFAFDRLNSAGGFNNEPIELMTYDHAGNPSTASDRFREAVAAGARVIVTSLTSATTGQLSEDVRRYNLRNPASPVLFLNQGSEASDLTGAKCHFYSFRLTTIAQMRAKALTSVMKSEGVLEGGVYSINQNYAFGQDMEAAVQANSSIDGYKVVGSVLHDMFRLQDFTPYVGRVRESGASAVITSSFASDLLLLIKASADSGLKVSFGSVFLDQPGNLASGRDALAGAYNAGTYNVGADKSSLPEEFKARVGHYPLYQVEGAVVAVLSLFGEALKTVSGPHGAPVDVQKIALALEKAKFNGPMGELSVRPEDHQLQMPLVVAKVQEDEKYPVDSTKWGFKVIKVLPSADLTYPVQESCKMVRP